MKGRIPKGLSRYRIFKNGRLFIRLGKILNEVKYFKRSGHLEAYVQYDDGHHARIRIHRLVAETFLPNPLGLSLIKHKDGNNLNCSVENILWTGQTSANRYKRKLRQYNAYISKNK